MPGSNAAIGFITAARPTDFVGDIPSVTRTAKRVTSLHTHPFYGPLDFVWNYLDEPVPEPI